MYYFKGGKLMSHSANYFMTALFMAAFFRNGARLILLLCTLMLTQFCFAETSVIVHPNNNSQLSPKDIQRIFMGKLKSFPNGIKIMAIDQPISSEARQEFGKKLLKKNPQQIKSYWARQIFTGKGIPPKELKTTKEVKTFVAQNESAIGYINTDLLDTTVKNVYTF
jgi:ABC-type phosphate transport system substrate-binding protein